MKIGWDSASERIGIVTGLAAEARIARRLGWPVAIGGGSAAGARRATQELIESGATALVSFGLAGGLDPALPAGTLLVPAAIRTDRQDWHVSAELAAKLGAMTPHALLGAGTIARTQADKRRLWEATGCAALDLESGAVAEAATRQRLPFAALRAICDPASTTLPPAALIALSGRGAISLGRVFGSIAAQPSQFGDLLQLGRFAAQARRSLIGRVAGIQEERTRRPAI